MDKAKWIKCLLVSFVIALIAPFFTFTGAVISTREPIVVPDDFDHVKGMSSQELTTYMNIPGKTRKIAGLEKLLFPFTMPGAWRFYMGSAFTIFVVTFIGCVFVTFWIGKTARPA